MINYYNKTNDTDFAYAVGRIRALENLLLKDNEAERMVLSDSEEDAFKVLNELDFADNKAGISNPSDFQAVLNDGLLDIKMLFKKILPDQKAMWLLYLGYDIHNIKTLLKAKLGGKTVEEVQPLMIKLGMMDPENLILHIFEEQKVQLTESETRDAYIKKIIKEAEELFKAEKENPEVIDLLLDQKLMKMLFGIAKDLNSEFLLTYITKLIDLNNIKLFFRMKAQKKELHLFEIAFIWNGAIPYKKFEDAYKENMEKITEVLRSTPYGKLIQTGYTHYKEEQTFIYLEKEIENNLVDYIRKAKQLAFGPEPVIAYFLANKNNALVIRMIMINKLNGIAPEEIQKRIRKLY